MFKELPNDLYSIDQPEEIFKQIEAFEVIQKPGETLFVPSGFMHQVVNLTDTISINHNWFNACNLEQIYANILEANKHVQNEISDLKEISSHQDWYDNCQKILSMHFGMNFDDFIKILIHIAHRLTKETNHFSEDFRVRHDVEMIGQIVMKMKTNNNDDERFHTFEQLLLNKLDSIINNIYINMI